MRVLHVIQTLAPRYGGPVASLNALAYFQACSGMRVTICTTNTDYPRGVLPVTCGSETVARGGVIVRFYPVQFRPLLISFPLMRWIRISVKKFDIVHIHGLYRFPVTYASFVARNAGVPYIITPHGALDPYLYRQSKYSILVKRLYEKMFDLPNMNCASVINFTTEDELKRASYLGLTSPTAIVPSGLDWSEYAELPLRGRFRKIIGIDMKVPVVLFLGRVNFKKGLNLLLPAFSIVAKKLPNAILAIVGPDNEGYGANVKRWSRKHGIQNKVFSIDYLKGDQVREAYVDADVFVLPSYTENFGLTVVEAMACGCPVIVSDQVNICSEVKRASAGLVVRLNIIEIARAVLSVLENKHMSQKMGESGRRLARNTYSYDNILPEMSRVYEAIARI